MAPTFPQQFGPYTLQELIARGGMAEVYRATMPGVGGFEKTVAIKKILPHLAENEEFIAMLVDEARIIVSLNHANIAQVYDLGKLDDTYYIAMEYVHAVDLADILKDLKGRGQTVPIAHATYIAGCICAGLHVAHAKTDEMGRPQNIVHRDVSPHNVLVSFGGDVKIIDFGVAKARGKETHTKAGVIKGKLLYMAPEQAMAKDIDGRADLFAAGLILYSMLTNQLPFEGENEFQIYNNILSKEVVPPKVINPSVPEDLNQIVMMLLQRDPNKRYQDGYSAKADLDRCLHSIAPGYSVGRLSAWIEDNFTHIGQAKRERRQNPSGRNVAEAAAQVQNAQAPAQQPAWPGAQQNAYGLGGSGSFPQQGFGQAGASGSFPQAGFGQAGASGSFPQAGFGQAGASGSFPQAGFGQAGFGQAGASGEFGAAGGFQNPTGFGSGQFAPMPPNVQSGTFAAPPVPATEDAKRKFPIVPTLAIFVVLALIGVMVVVELQKKQEEVAAGTIPPPLVDPTQNRPEPEANLAPATAAQELADEGGTAAQEVVEKVTMQFGSEPSGAMIYLDGEAVGPAPISMPNPRGDAPLVFEARMEGFETSTFEVVPQADVEHTFVLVAATADAGADSAVAEPATEPEKVEAPVEPEPVKVEEKKVQEVKTTTKSTTKTTTKKDTKPADDGFLVPVLGDEPKKTTKKGKDKPAEEENIINPFE